MERNNPARATDKKCCFKKGVSPVFSIGDDVHYSIDVNNHEAQIYAGFEINSCP
jgi:hypothetical protein